MYPSSSSLAISLRTVAAEMGSPNLRTTVSEPTGMAVLTYSLTMWPNMRARLSTGTANRFQAMIA